MIICKSLQTVWIAVIFSFGASSVIFAKNSASINAFGLQVSLGIANSSLGGSLYFTTYDASTTYPLNDNYTVSGELRPIEKGSSVFVTDYLAVDSSVIHEYGTVSLNFPETDSDNNGVPDWLQKNMSVNMNVTGSSEIHYHLTGFSGNASLNGTFVRSAGLSSGSYNITFNIPNLGTGIVSGTWHVSYYNGTIEYDDTFFYINAETINADGQIVKAKGSSEYTVSPNGKLNLSSVNLDVDGDTVQMQSMLFERSNSTYSVLATAIDGLPDTSWPDFTQWYIEISDSNDDDNDGNPDFSDLDRIIISSHSTLSADGWGWINWPWAYSDFYKSWFYFYPTGVGEISIFHIIDQRWYSWNASSQSWVSAD